MERLQQSRRSIFLSSVSQWDLIFRDSQTAFSSPIHLYNFSSDGKQEEGSWPTGTDEIASQLYMSKDMAAEQVAKLDRSTHQRHPSYRTISDTIHLTVTTVIKHVTKLVDRQFITIENISCIDKHGMKWNGNDLYTILPILAAMDYCCQQQMLRLEEQTLVHQQGKLAPCALLGGQGRHYEKLQLILMRGRSKEKYIAFDACVRRQ